jgi:tetratricopeptide (TPR) repeat protein
MQVRPSIRLGFVLALALSLRAQAQSPREQLEQLVVQLQRTPTDNALRERVLKLGAEMKPAPAIPEEANRAFVKGNVFLKEAQGMVGYDLAITAYRDALRIAPWWGDAYFNLGVALTSANRFDEAIVSFKLYMHSVLSESAEARDAQNRIYALEAKSEMATKQAAIAAAAQAAANSPQAREAALLEKVEGARFVIPLEIPVKNPPAADQFLDVRGGTLNYTLKIYANPEGYRLYGRYVTPGEYPHEKYPFRDGAFRETNSDGSIYAYAIRSDGQALIKTLVRKGDGWAPGNYWPDPVVIPRR